MATYFEQVKDAYNHNTKFATNNVLKLTKIKQVYKVFFLCVNDFNSV